MDRRTALKQALFGGGALGLMGGANALGAAAPAYQQATRGLPDLKITNVSTIYTAPRSARLVVVKVETSEPGLYGLGCATFSQRADAVVVAVEKYLKPFLIGRNPANIEDVWQTSYTSSYWRNGPVLNNAMSGVDQALWDINGKRAGMPVYQLLGGKARAVVPCYGHASGRDQYEVEERVREYMEKGYRHVRAQVATPNMAGYGSGRGPQLMQVWDDPVFEPRPYIERAINMFDHLRKTVGWEVELLHDIHERVPPILAIDMAKRLEQYRLFFLEDPFSPEDIGYFEMLREQCATPISMGELFNSPHEWVGLITNRLIDFIRVHISQIGGVTPARKLTALCEWFNVRTAFHGPGDVSPIGHMANITLSANAHNFGIQEAAQIGEKEQEVFPGSPVIESGNYVPNDAPGWGIDVDEKLAAKYPPPDKPTAGNGLWMPIRNIDGTSVRP
jgi:mannonate dehydratase